MTNIPGLYATGEARSSYHGANRLGANSLLSCIFDGMVGRPGGREVRPGQRTAGRGVARVDLRGGRAGGRAQVPAHPRMDGPENPYVLADELGKVMTDNVTVVRYNAKLEETLVKIAELKERYERIGVPDTGSHSNQPAVVHPPAPGMLVLAEVITKGALLRDESRGAHYKPEFPERDRRELAEDRHCPPHRGRAGAVLPAGRHHSHPAPQAGLLEQVRGYGNRGRSEEVHRTSASGGRRHRISPSTGRSSASRTAPA